MSRKTILLVGLTVASLLVAQTSPGKNPPKTKGKTPTDTFVVSEPEYVAPTVVHGLMAPDNYHELPVSTAKKSGYANSYQTAAAIRKLGTNAQPWWQIAANAVEVQSTQFRGIVSPASAWHPFEPVITSLTKGGVTYSVAAWFDGDYVLAPKGKLFAARITHNTTGGGVIEQGVQLNRSGEDYDQVADPVLACNPYTDGIAPGRVYLAGLNFKRDSSGHGINPNAIHVWGSPDAGKTWDNGGSLVQQTKEDPATPYQDHDLDKPWIDVSWHPGTRGYLYAVWVEWHYAHDGIPAAASNKIRIRRSVNGASRRCRPFGGVCDNPFEPSFYIDDGSSLGYAIRPQVVVNPINGEVYVLWVKNNKIVLRKAPAIVGKNVAGGRDLVATDFGPTYTIATLRTTTIDIRPGFPIHPIPIARFNHVTGKLMVVWHDRPSTTSTADTAIYLAYFTPSSLISGQPTTLQVNNAAGYQFQPTIDNDDAGNMMISYYSSEHDTVNHFFKPYAVLRDSGGFSTLKGPTAFDEETGNFPGDYRDIWYFGFTDSVGPRWHAAYTMTAPNDTRVTGLK